MAMDNVKDFTMINFIMLEICDVMIGVYLLLLLEKFSKAEAGRNTLEASMSLH